MVSECGMVIAAAMMSLELTTGPEFPCIAECGFFCTVMTIFYAEHTQSFRLPQYARLFLLRRVKMKKSVSREALIEVSGTDFQVLCTSDHLASLTSHSSTVLCFCRFTDSLMRLGSIVGLQQTAWTERHSFLWRLLHRFKPVANSGPHKWLTLDQIDQQPVLHSWQAYQPGCGSSSFAIVCFHPDMYHSLGNTDPTAPWKLYLTMFVLHPTWDITEMVWTWTGSSEQECGH